jgi:hypothetical protein
MIQRFSITCSYEKRWIIDGMEHYCFTETKELFNSKTGRKIKKTLVGYTQGYWIGKKFYTLNKLRPLLKRPVNFDIPF